MKRPPAKSFQDLLVWQKAHHFVLAVYLYTEGFPDSLILAQDLGYGDNTELRNQLEEISKLLEAYLSSILNSGS